MLTWKEIKKNLKKWIFGFTPLAQMIDLSPLAAGALGWKWGFWAGNGGAQSCKTYTKNCKRVQNLYKMLRNV